MLINDFVTEDMVIYQVRYDFLIKKTYNLNIKVFYIEEE